MLLRKKGMFNKHKIIFLSLGVIFFVGLFIRLNALSSFPVGFHQDEASVGYNGYSLLITGKDENNNPFPLYIDMFGDNRPSGYHYLTIIPIMLFGLTEFSTRLPGAIFGSLTIIAFFFLTHAVFKNRLLGLVSSLLLALAPWHVSLSRASDEAIVALFFIVVGFTFFIHSIRNNSKKQMIIGTFILIVSFFFYHTPRVFVPLLFFIALISCFPILKKTNREYKIACIFLFLFISLIAFVLVFSIPGGTWMFGQVNIFSNFQTVFFQTQQIQEDAIAQSSYFASRFFHNKITNVLLVFISNYFDYFGLNFLFTKGGLPIWYSIPRQGLLYLIELPFIAIGMYQLIRRKVDLIHVIPLYWLLIGPFVAAITMDDVPNINRSLVMFPMFDLVAAFGFLYVVNNLKRKQGLLFILLSVSALLVSFFYFLHQYYYNAKTHNPWYRNNGFKAMMEEVKKSYNSYDKVVITKYQGGTYPLVLFYMKFDPRQYQKEGSPKSKEYGGFGKFFFVPQDCPSVQTTDKTPSGRILFVDYGGCKWDKSLAFKKITFIDREDRSKAFRMVYE